MGQIHAIKQSILATIVDTMYILILVRSHDSNSLKDVGVFKFYNEKLFVYLAFWADQKTFCTIYLSIILLSKLGTIYTTLGIICSDVHLWEVNSFYAG